MASPTRFFCDANIRIPAFRSTFWCIGGSRRESQGPGPACRTENSSPRSRPQNLLVRSGKIVNARCWTANYIHMTLPVLCLQNGGRGQQVRVISKETKKTYVARVTGPGVVTSTMSGVTEAYENDSYNPGSAAGIRHTGLVEFASTASVLSKVKITAMTRRRPAPITWPACSNRLRLRPPM